MTAFIPLVRATRQHDQLTVPLGNSRQHHLDCQVGLEPLAAGRRPARRLPSGQRRIVDLERQVAAAAPPGLVGWPVRYPETPLRDAVTATRIVLEGHEMRVAGRSAARDPAATLHQR